MASAFPSIKTGYKLFNIANDDTYSKILFAGYRFFLSSIMIFLYCFITKYPIKISKKNIYKLILLGILQTLFQYIFFYIGLSNTTGVKGSILSSSGTFVAVIIAHFFYAEDKMTWKKILGLILGFAGVIIVNSKKGSFSGVSQNIAFTPAGSVLLLYMAFISAAAFSIWTTLLKYNGVGRVSIYKFLIPLFGVFLSFIILKESFSSSNVILAVISTHKPLSNLKLFPSFDTSIIFPSIFTATFPVVGPYGSSITVLSATSLGLLLLLLTLGINAITPRTITKHAATRPIALIEYPS